MVNRFLGHRAVLAPLSILLLAMALYAQSLSYGYVWDDTPLFVDKTALANEPLSWALLSEPVLPGTSYFRPLIILSMFAEFHLFGQQPAVSHAVNVGIFLINALLVYLLALQLVRKLALPGPELRAWLAAILYVVHPALVESAAWVSGRFDLMVTTFMLLGLYVSMLAMRPLTRLLLVCLAMMAGLLSKELAVVMPALVLCLWLAVHGREYRSPLVAMQQAFVHNSLLLAGMLCTFAVYMVLRIDAVGEVYHVKLTGEHIKMVWIERRMPLEALKFYLGHTFLPFSDISPMHPAGNIDFDSLSGRVGAWLVGLSVIVLFGWALLRRTAASWLLVAWLACITPVLHLVPLGVLDNVGHDRFLTSALAFWALAMVVMPYQKVPGFMQEQTRRLVLRMSAVVWIGFALLTTLSVMPMWASELRFWHWVYQSHADSVVVRYNYLYSTLYENRQDIFLKEINGYLQSGKGLEVGEQLLYAKYLIGQGDREGKKYTEGVLYALPAFHDMPDGRYHADNFYLTSLQMAGAYGDYANALMVFDGDAEQALRYNRIAEWYMREGEKIPVLYQRAAILYALDDFDGAQAIVNDLEGLYHARKDKQKQTMNQLLQLYCEVHQFNTASCSKMLARKMVVKVSPGT